MTKKKNIRQKNGSVWSYMKHRDTIFATISVFILMGLLSLIPINTHILDPFKLALKDFNYNDLVYSKMEKNKNATLDTNIVVVNIGDAGRADIAEMIKIACHAKAKVVGVDVLFKVAKETVADSALSQIFSKQNKLVMAYNLIERNGGFVAEGYFLSYARNKGYANFVGEEQGVIRYFKADVQDKELRYNAFATEILKIAHPGVYKRIIARNKDLEIINFRGTKKKHLVLDGRKFIDGAISEDVLRNKIVLLGYVAKNESDIEDMHYTPLNTVFAGRGVPDMNGIFIHANIISMAIDDAYIHKTPTWINWSIAFIVCWLHMAFFIKYSKEKHVWFHFKAKIVSLTMAIVFVYLGLWSFYYFDAQINLTATLASVILALDVLYFYESFAIWLHRNFGYKTIFAHEVH